MSARIRLDGDTPRACAASSTRASSASGIRRLTIWRIVSGDGSCHWRLDDLDALEADPELLHCRRRAPSALHRG